MIFRKEDLKPAPDGKIVKIIERAAELTGTASGLVVGALVGGFPGILLSVAQGEVLGKSLKALGLEMYDRISGPRQMIRYGAAYTFALNRIAEKIEEGEGLRNDDFMIPGRMGRAASEEILEAALQFAQNEAEELKVKHYGYLLANIYFDSSIDRGCANFLLKSAEKLSYRQFCLLHIFTTPEEYGLFVKHVPKPERNVARADVNSDVNHRVVRTQEGKILVEQKPISLFNTPGSPKITEMAGNFIEVSLLPKMNRPDFKRGRSDLYAEIADLQLLGIVDKLPAAEQESYNSVKLTGIGRLLSQHLELSKLSSEDIGDLVNVLRYEEKAS